MDVVGESVSTWDHLRVVVGTDPVQLVAGTVNFAKGVQIKAHPDNTGIVYIGKSDVTTGGTAATDGYYLAAGDEFFVPADQSGEVFGRASAADQNVFVAYA